MEVILRKGDQEMSNLDCELHRLRVTREMKAAIKIAAELDGVSEAAWRKRTIAVALINQLGGGWMRGEIKDAQETGDDRGGVDSGDADGGDDRS